MSPQLEQILQQINQLSSTEQAEVLQHLTHPIKTVQSSTPTQTKHRASSFYGKAPNMLQGLDAQAWVNSERDEWAEREIAGSK
jgi:hypothetical protein